MKQPNDTRFKKGNPGRKAGSRNRATMAVETLLDGQGEALTQKAVSAALDGDMTAMKLCLDRICPPRKSRPVQISLPPIQSANDIVDAYSAVFSAMASGELTPDEASVIGGVLEAKRKAVETVDLEARLSALEARQ